MEQIEKELSQRRCLICNQIFITSHPKNESWQIVCNNPYCSTLYKRFIVKKWKEDNSEKYKSYQKMYREQYL